jgi:hypothetical protein
MSDITPLSNKEARMVRSHWLVQGNKQKTSQKTGGTYVGYFKMSVATRTIDDALALVRKNYPECQILSVINQGAIDVWED